MWRELLRSPPRSLADASVRQRLSAPVPADDAAFAERKGTLKLALRTMRRAVLLQGFYGGPDFHRARFATTRLADLLGLSLTLEEHSRHSAQKLPLNPPAVAQAEAASPTPGGVALALGGVWPQRTYHRWSEL